MSSGESLITVYDCPLENKFEELWSHYNYIVYVVEGQKIWHTPQGSFDLREGACVLVKKGASIVEQFFDSKFCLVLFFIPDKFICEVLKLKSKPLKQNQYDYKLVMPIENTASLKGFYNSMLSYFESKVQPDAAILDLKFKELILTIADNPSNKELMSYFCSLMQEPQAISLQKIMEENFCYNLKLEAFAKLCARSLSTFKRDFQNIYQTSPAKWLLEKRLNHAHYLITQQGKTVSEASFESGFENQSHFSSAFKKRFGKTPLSSKK